jgi:hypothetical protein
MQPESEEYGRHPYTWLPAPSFPFCFPGGIVGDSTDRLYLVELMAAVFILVF